MSLGYVCVVLVNLSSFLIIHMHKYRILQQSKFIPHLSIAFLRTTGWPQQKETLNLNQKNIYLFQSYSCSGTLHNPNTVM